MNVALPASAQPYINPSFEGPRLSRPDAVPTLRCLARRVDHEARLNWDAFGARLHDILERVTGEARNHHSATHAAGTP